MTNKEFLRVFRFEVVQRINLHPKKQVEQWKKEGNMFASSWVEKGETERRAKKRERRAS